MRRRGLRASRVAALAAATLALVPAAAAADHRETFLVSRGGDDAASPSGVSHLGSTADGSHVFFGTADALAPEDEDSAIDIYDRHDGRTDLVSRPEPGLGGSGGAGALGFASPGAARVYFVTRENLTADDSDFSPSDDVYLRAGDSMRLVSRSSGGFGFGLAFFFWCGATPDGKHAFFRTTKALSDTDFEFSFDVFSYDAETDTLEQASVDSSGQNTSGTAVCGGFTDDGSAVFFSTSDRMTPDDTDSFEDVYRRSGGATTLMTPGTPGADAAFRSVSGDGSRVVFVSSERLASEDTDDQIDVYSRSGATVELVSQGPGEFNGAVKADFQRASHDGARVFFTTSEHVVPADTDDADDIFVREGGTTSIVSHGPEGGDSGADIIVEQLNATGDRLYFRTGEPLTADDEDFSSDSYVWRPGQPLERVSVAALNDNSTGYDTGLAGATDGGERVFFTSQEQMHEDDLDTPPSTAPTGRDDIFVRENDVSGFVSTGPASGTSPAVDAFFKGHSADGKRVWWETTERLTDDDEDDANDVYESRVNESPVLAGAGTVPYRDGDPAVAIAPGLTVTDPDTAELTGARVRIVSGFAAGDELRMPPAAGIDAQLGPGGRELVLSGTASHAAYQAALRTVTFGTDGADTTAGARTVEFDVSDAVDTSNGSQATVNVALRAPEAGGRPVVSGVARVGATLHSTEPGWAGSRPLDDSLAWERCDAAGSRCAPIAGAAGPDYEVRPEDEGATLRAVAYASNAAGGADVASDPTAVVRPGPAAPGFGEAPAALSSDGTPRFAFSGEPGASFECGVDGGGFAACGSPLDLDGLADGTHALRVRQMADGLRSPAALHEWTIDTRAPGAPTVAGPAPGAAGTWTVAFGGEPGGTFACSIDGSAFADCASPVGLRSGDRSFAVRQTDVAGNAGPATELAFGGGLLAAGLRFGSPLVPDDLGLPVQCTVADGSLERCEVVAEAAGAGAGRSGASGPRRAAAGVRPAASGFVVGRGAARVGRRGHRSAVVHVRLTRGGIARIRRAGGSLRVALRVTATTFDGRRSRPTGSARVALPQRYVLPVAYGVGVARLTPLQRRHLQAMARQLGGTRRVVCAGHADASARPRHARRLGLRRAGAVCRFLRKQGVAARLRTVSRGSARPRASNATPGGRALNRRVEVIVVR